MRRKSKKVKFMKSFKFSGQTGDARGARALHHPHHLADLKARWGVSLQALIRRALTLAIISPSQYRSLSAQLGARGWRTREPVAVSVERPQALRQLVAPFYGVSIDYPALARATGLDPAFVRDLLDAHAAGS
jgi:Zn-dependent peptidase ImmA (M78 family)